MFSSPHERPTETDTTAAGLAVAAALASLLWATVVSNHPTNLSGRLRQFTSPFVLWLPGWRFFAPDPAVYDFSVLYRVRTRSGTVSDWREMYQPMERAWWHTMVFPGRREEKSLRAAVVALLAEGSWWPATALPRARTYRLIEALVRQHISLTLTGKESPEGFQFALVKYAGYDEQFPPQYLLVSAYSSA